MKDQEVQELLKLLSKLVTALEKNGVPQEHGATDIILSIVPMVGIVFGAAILFFFLLWNYRLKKELIRTQQYHYTSVKTLRMLTLLIGFVSTLVGLPMTLLFYLVEGVSYVMLGGLIPVFAGIGLLSFYAFTRKQEER